MDSTYSTTLLFQAMGVLAVAVPVLLLVSANRKLAGWINFLTMLLAGGLCALAASHVLMRGATGRIPLPILSYGACELNFEIDGLSAIFLMLILGLAMVASLFSIEYMHHYRDYGVTRYYPWFPLFVLGMVGIVTTTDLWVGFTLFWQMMTWASFFLVRYEHRKPENVAAARRYLLMMQIAWLLCVLPALMLGGWMPAAGEFVQVRKNLAVASPGLLSTVLAMFFIGFGIKAGIFPFGQMWLPDAHPAAPSPISAMLSGVMIKTGVYGILRTFFWLAPCSPTFFSSSAAGTGGLDSGHTLLSAVWGTILAVAGLLTLVTGTFQALKQNQTKRLLAFSSIGQIGYIFLAMGAALVLSDEEPSLRILASIGIYGALFHTLNHGMFKGLLFLTSGAVLAATETQEFNSLGGLARRIPATALTAAVASLAIAGVPPLNGFASKWCIWLSTLLAGRAAPFLVFSGIIALFISAVTLAALIKYFSCVFLATGWEGERDLHHKPPWLMNLAQVILAAGCVLAGLFPATVIRLITLALNTSGDCLLATSETYLFHFPGLSGVHIALPAEDTAMGLLVPVALLLAMSSLVYVAWVIARLGASQRRNVTPWLCGYHRFEDPAKFTAHHLFEPLTRRLGWLGGNPPMTPKGEHAEKQGETPEG